MPKDLNVTLLFDIYGNLLTEKQRETMELYYNADLSLGEISEETGITRQGVMNCIKKSENHLRELEEKLGLADRLHALDKDIEKLQLLLYDAEVKNMSRLGEIEDVIAEIKQKL